MRPVPPRNARQRSSLAVAGSEYARKAFAVGRLTVYASSVSLYARQPAARLFRLPMPRLLTPEIPDPADPDAQYAFFRAHSYLILPDLLAPDQVRAMNEAMDRDMARHPFMWYTQGVGNYNCNLWLAEPVFEEAIRPPRLLAILDRLMGGPFCFEELAVRHSPGETVGRSTAWHRDRAYWTEHPLHLDYAQIIYYLTDVDAATHCFTISPEPAGGAILERDEHLARHGMLHFHGRAGTGILFNAATWHGVTLRRTARTRRTIQVYFGHPARPPLSDATLMPPRLWRDHPDAEIRRFYGKLNRYSELVLAGLGLSTRQT